MRANKKGNRKERNKKEGSDKRIEKREKRTKEKLAMVDNKRICSTFGKVYNPMDF